MLDCFCFSLPTQANSTLIFEHDKGKLKVKLKGQTGTMMGGLNVAAVRNYVKILKSSYVYLHYMASGFAYYCSQAALQRPASVHIMVRSVPLPTVAATRCVRLECRFGQSIP